MMPYDFSTLFDYILEIDSQFIVCDVKGSLDGLKPLDKGQSLKDSVISQDYSYVQELLRNIQINKRIIPTRIGFKCQRKVPLYVLMSGIKLDQNKIILTFQESYRYSFIQSRESMHKGVLNRLSFKRLSKHLLSQIYYSDTPDDYRMTLLRMGHYEEIRSKVAKDIIHEFENELIGKLRYFSIGGEAIGSFGFSKYGLIHTTDYKTKDIQNAVSELTERYFKKDKPVINSYEIILHSDEVVFKDAAKVLYYLLDKFIDTDGQDFYILNIDEGLKSVINNTVSRVKALRETIENRNFDVFYQPIIDVQTREIRHYEALTRFNGLGSTQMIVPFAEEVGVVEDFDLAVCQRVLEFIESQSTKDNSPIVAANISAKSLESKMFIDELERIIEPYKHLRKNLMFEITETAQLQNFEKSNQIVKELQEKGHKFCLDDVGSGTTSFQSLYNLEVDYAKIDGYCLKLFATDPRQQSIVRSIVKVCKELKIKMVAEQIETEEENKIVTDLGIELGQGFLYGKPMQY